MKKTSYATKLNHQLRLFGKGFTLLEVVIVICLLSLLAAVALPRLKSVIYSAERASLKSMGGAFGMAVALAHAQWYVNGGRRGMAEPNAKVSVNMDGKIVYVNENGWPANTRPDDDASINTQTPQECLDIWASLLQSSPAATISPQDWANARYFISVLPRQDSDNVDAIGSICRYAMILKNDSAAQASHYLDYDLTNGDVSVTQPVLGD